MKKFMSVLLAFALIFGGMANFSLLKFDSFKVESRAATEALSYVLNSDKKSYKVIGCSADAVEITVPDTYNKKPVTVIGERAFENCQKLTNVTIGANVKTIESFAFANCKSLNLQLIPDTVTKVGAGVFYNCTGLTGVKFSEGIKEIPTNAGDKVNSHRGFLEGCKSLSLVVLPSKLAKIGNYAFSGCVSLADIDIPTTVKTIGAGAFENCKALTSVILPNAVKTISRSLFKNCVALNSVTMAADVSKIEGSAFYNTAIYNNPSNWVNDMLVIDAAIIDAKETIKECVIPTGVSVIADYAFAWCNQLETVDIKDGLKSVSAHAFDGCANLKSVRLPKSVTKIGEKAFYKCNSKMIIHSEKATFAQKFANNNSIVFMEVPHMVSAVSTSTGVKVTWDKIDGAQSYRVYRKRGDNPWKLVGKTTATSFVDKGAVSGDTSLYTVRSEINKNLSLYESVISIDYVKAPHIYKVYSAKKGFDITWGKVGGATAYRVYRKGATGNWKYIDKVTTNTYNDTAVSNGEVWQYTVRAEMGSILSKYESGKSSLQTPKLGKTVKKPRYGVKVSWSAVKDADSYRIYRKNGSKPWKYIGDSVTTTFLDEKLPEGVDVLYTVRAEKEGSLSWYDVKGIAGKY